MVAKIDEYRTAWEEISKLTDKHDLALERIQERYRDPIAVQTDSMASMKKMLEEGIPLSLVSEKGMRLTEQMNLGEAGLEDAVW